MILLKIFVAFVILVMLYTLIEMVIIKNRDNGRK